jgi:uncharacterized GH25 family protein
MNLKLLTIASLLFASAALAHDTWVQTNANLVRAGEVVDVHLMLGNHGNNHRDFKLAGKVDPKTVTLDVIAPDGAKTDLKPSLVDRGLSEKEGFWTASFRTTTPGLYTVVQTSDRVVSYAPERSIKSAKTFFVAATSLDKPTANNPGYDRVLGHAFELVPQLNPVTPMGPGERLSFKLLFKGQPLANETVALIPRGATLEGDFDAKHERKTDANGIATFEVADANLYLAAAHHGTDEKGEGYTGTKYGATVSVWVPATCACCGE